MTFTFEKFVDTQKSFAARVTIRQRTGQLGFNLGSINLYNIRNYNYAVLYFDEGNRVVGVGLTNDKAEGAIEIKQRKANTYVRAKNFLDKYGVDYSESHTHDLKKDCESGLLYFSLGDVVESSEEDGEVSVEDGNVENGKT